MTQRSAENYKTVGKPVIKFESLSSTFKGAVEFREEKQTMT